MRRKEDDFERVFDLRPNNDAKLPIGMGFICVDSKLYLIGGEHLHAHDDDDDDKYPPNFDVFALDLNNPSIIIIIIFDSDM
ncbi:hypothetical protein LOK49_LG08G03405 [Camellia lanceoleosa]|uniref:Uncharacterized protein n=1 Tax=Camellia lanceoleosa TaxID=1840588 RepID=A0ACC0GPR2_9ERIC|nr:hypothetical protein LOK49_LG08G03405 [Camellia lanceoleosa]